VERDNSPLGWIFDGEGRDAGMNAKICILV
jgi:hypothetical protein